MDGIIKKGTSSISHETDDFIILGIGASLGRDAMPDRVTAHKWFNIAAACGSGQAVALRAELAREMTQEERATAQRLAREYLATLS